MRQVARRAEDDQRAGFGLRTVGKGPRVRGCSRFAYREQWSQFGDERKRDTHCVARFTVRGRKRRRNPAWMRSRRPGPRRAAGRPPAQGRRTIGRLWRGRRGCGWCMETIPGVIVTQHSGSGKANQYFLRGFNLDHGTDLATDFEGMPINMPTHAHGQGYTDLNFLIPELVSEVDYKKGNYYAGSRRLRQRGRVQHPLFRRAARVLLKVEGGDIGYERAVFAMSPKLGPGHLLLRPRTGAQRRPVGPRRRLPEVQRRGELQRRRRPQRREPDRPRLPRRLELHRPGARARHPGKAHRPLRRDRPDRRRQLLALRPQRRLASRHRKREHARGRLRHVLRPRIVLATSTIS